MKISDHVSWSPHGEEFVLLDMATGAYYSLNRLGSTIWRHLSAGKSPAGIVAMLHDEYEVDEVTAAIELQRFLDKLASAGLLTDEGHLR